MLELSNTNETLLIDYNGKSTPFTQAHAEMLFDDLREWRWNKAAGMPAYYVLDDKTLRNIVNVLPTEINMLWLVHGVKGVKIDTYGKGIIDLD